MTDEAYSRGMDLRLDPIYIRVGNDLNAIKQQRISVLREQYNIVGINELGGDIRPHLLICNMNDRNMFDHSNPKIGDIVALGFTYSFDAEDILICQLAEYHTERDQKPRCHRSGYWFSWSVDPIATHHFDKVVM